MRGDGRNLPQHQGDGFWKQLRGGPLLNSLPSHSYAVEDLAPHKERKKLHPGSSRQPWATSREERRDGKRNLKLWEQDLLWLPPEPVDCSPLFKSGFHSYMHLPMDGSCGARAANGAGLRGSGEKAESNGDRCSVYCLCKTGNRAENVSQQLEGIPCLSTRHIGPVMYVHSFSKLTGRLCVLVTR